MTSTVTIQQKNKLHYDRSWGVYPIADHGSWPHWGVIQSYAPKGRLLEIGPGNRPRIPVKGNAFIEISSTSVKALRSQGGEVAEVDLTHKLPFRNASFLAVCAFEVLEHLPNDTEVLKEISRVLKSTGTVFVSFPLNQSLWNRYDETVGHVKRYDPKAVESFFHSAGLFIVGYSGIAIPWPTPAVGAITSWFHAHLPRQSSTIGHFLDILPGSPVRAPIQVKPWNNHAPQDLKNYTTGFFILKKMSSVR